MWILRENSPRRYTGFFRITFCHENLSNYYKTNFALIHHHKYSLTELENMIPWEREIYITMLIQFIEEEKQRMEQQKLSNKSR